MRITRWILRLSIAATAMWGENALAGSGFQVSAPPPPAVTDDARDNRGGMRPSIPDCSRPNTDPRCRPPHPPYYQPHPYHRPRPVIVNQLPPEPAIELHSLTDDWEGCRKAKLGAIRARHSGHTDEAKNLDEWLWKNCRSYSNELRDLEQDDM